MKIIKSNYIYIIFLLVFITTSLYLIHIFLYFGSTSNEIIIKDVNDSIKNLNWKRPDGPVRVGLQIGHLDSKDLPDELEKIRTHTGTSSNGITEVSVNKTIVNKTAEILRKNKIVVDILPATIPPSYYADAFIAVHADGNLNRDISGFKVAGPRRDITGKSSILVKSIEKFYSQSTKLAADPGITRNMTGYYAFSIRRYRHAVHAMSPKAIIETGFLTSTHDQKILLNKSDLAAAGIANGIIAFLQSESLL